MEPDRGAPGRIRGRAWVPVSDSLDPLLDDASVDLVLILTPPWTHLDLVRRCAERGKAVLLEKPIEATLERSEQVVALCEAAGIPLGVVFQNRTRSPHQRLRALIGDGRLGDLVSAAATVRWWRAPEYYAEAGRGLKDRDGGGVLLTQAIHVLDQLLDLTGPAAMSAAITRPAPGAASTPRTSLPARCAGPVAASARSTAPR